MTTLIEELNNILESDLYKKILNALPFEITGIEHLNTYIDLIKVDIFDDEKYINGFFNIKNYKVLKDYETILNNGMSCIEFLCKFYRELLIYAAINLQKSIAVEVIKDTKNILKMLIFYKLNNPNKNIRFENNFAIKLYIIAIQNFEIWYKALRDGINIARKLNLIKFDICDYERYYDERFVELSKEEIIDMNTYIYEGFDLDTDY